MKAIVLLTLLIITSHLKDNSNNIYQRNNFAILYHKNSKLLSKLTHSPILFMRSQNIWMIKNGIFKKIIINAQYPAWSKNKSKIAFVRNNNIWICNASGKYQRQITTFTAKNNSQDQQQDSGFVGIELNAITSLSWDPTGNIIIFSRIDDYSISRDIPDKYEIFQNDITKNTHLQISDIYACIPKLSKDKRTFVWISESTSGLPSHSVTYSALPVFAPNGKWIAFARNGDLWKANLFTFSPIPPSSNSPIPLWAWPQNYWDWSETRLLATAKYEGGSYASNSTEFISHISISHNSKTIAYSLTGLSQSGDGENIYLFHPQHHNSNIFFIKGDYPTFNPEDTFIAFNNDYTNYTNQYLGIDCVSLNSKIHLLITNNGRDPQW